MNGGTILHNAAPDGGGVIVGEVNEYKSDQNPVSTMVMNGGTIDSNISWRQAGGLFVNGNADVTINGGSIINNETGLIGAQPNPAGVGAGIVVHSGYRGQPDFNVDDINAWNLGKLTINDAIINGNHASAAGGGIYVNSNNVTINKAQITNNVADIHGGGIYISIAEFTLHLGNSLITENEATDGVTSGVPEAPLLPGSGGGIWFCPTGSAMVYITDGTAIFGNKALNHGDDILSEAKSADELTTLSNRMLGGGGAKWMHDRDGEQETTPVTVQNETGYIGLKNTATKAAEAVAAGMATVLIKGNKAPRGGGIGANGSVIFGSNVAGKAIKVNKEWDLGKTTTKPNKVTLNLVIDDATSPQNGEIVDTIELNADNNWTDQFADLPANVQYRVTEDKLEGFDSTNTELKDLGNGVFEVTFTNKAIEKPVNPDKPVVPDKPVTPPDKPVTPPDTPVTPVTPEQPVVPVQPNVVITPSEVVPVNETTEPGKIKQVVEGNDQADPKATRQIPEVTPQVTDQKVVTPVKLSETITPVTDQPASIQVEKQQAELPQTGDKQSITPIMLGFLLMLASLGGLVLSKKRHEFK